MIKNILSYIFMRKKLSKVKGSDDFLLLYRDCANFIASNKNIFPYTTENLKEILRANPEAESIAVLIGPEGGFSPSEAETIQNMNKNTFCAGLGKRILRTETAGSTALSVIMYEKESDFPGLVDYYLQNPEISRAKIVAAQKITADRLSSAASARRFKEILDWLRQNVEP